MRVSVEAATRAQRSGIEAVARAPRLTGYGATEQSALESLRRSVRAWVIGLRSGGYLEEALSDHALDWSPEGDEVEVSISVLESQPSGA